MLPALLEGLIGPLVGLVSSLLLKTGNANSPSDIRVWVLPLLKEVASQFDKFIPSWLKPEESALEELLTDAINRAIDALEKK